MATTKPPPILVLFDIDRTLLCAGPEPVAAMTHVGRAMYGDHFSLDGVNRSGHLDALIFAEACAQSGIEPGPEDGQTFHATYCQTLAETGLTAEALPHAQTLVHDLCRPAFDHVTLGVVTGNFECAARQKLARIGLGEAPFVANGFGHEAPTRPALVALAMQRAETHALQTLDPTRVLIVGDTPRDVEAARANGCRVWAVSTGKYSSDALTGATVITDVLPMTAETLLAALDL